MCITGKALSITRSALLIIGKTLYIIRRALIINRRVLFITKKALYIITKTLCITRREMCITRRALCITKLEFPDSIQILKSKIIAKILKIKNEMLQNQCRHFLCRPHLLFMTDKIFGWNHIMRKWGMEILTLIGMYKGYKEIAINLRKKLMPMDGRE